MTRPLSLNILTLVLASFSTLAGASQNQSYADPGGFSVSLPPGWRVQKFQQGYVRMNSADERRFVLIRPILGRSTDCATSLRRTFAASWSAFPGARGVEIGGVPGSRGLATARFSFQDGRARGSVLCAETSGGTGMYYGIGGPAESFAQDVGSMVAILKSFRYGGGARPTGASAASGPVALPRMTAWQEPRELAYTLQVPEGWRVTGGLTRIDATHAKSGVEIASPDGQALLRFGDPRVPTCTVPGQGMASMGSGGMTLCPYQTGRQAGEQYLHRTLAREWGVEGLQILSSKDRPEMSQAADRGPAQFGLNVRNAFAEVHFRGSRRGARVEGWLLANTQMMASVAGQNFILGTYTTDINSFVAPPARAAELAAISGHIVGSTRWSIEWWQREQRIGIELARKTLAMMHAQGEEQQKSFWARMEASDRRRDAVNDILGGTVRLSDGEGHVYDAKAGSNYYFMDLNEARRASRPNDAVVGTDVYPAPLVDLRPLEVIR